MERRLARCSGLHMYSSRTSFLLMMADTHTAAGIYEAMAARRFLIRDCSNFFGLGDRYFRISLKTETINGQCADALTRILEST
jgi:threonine-phosphate decarboxylase